MRRGRACQLFDTPIRGQSDRVMENTRFLQPVCLLVLRQT